MKRRNFIQAALGLLTWPLIGRAKAAEPAAELIGGLTQEQWRMIVGNLRDCFQNTLHPAITPGGISVGLPVLTTTYECGGNRIGYERPIGSFAEMTKWAGDVGRRIGRWRRAEAEACEFPLYVQNWAPSMIEFSEDRKTAKISERGSVVDMNLPVPVLIGQMGLSAPNAQRYTGWRRTLDRDCPKRERRWDAIDAGDIRAGDIVLWCREGKCEQPWTVVRTPTSLTGEGHMIVRSENA